jgi:hypothetical protein
MNVAEGNPALGIREVKSCTRCVVDDTVPHDFRCDVHSILGMNGGGVEVRVRYLNTFWGARFSSIREILEGTRLSGCFPVRTDYARWDAYHESRENYEVPELPSCVVVNPPFSDTMVPHSYVRAVNLAMKTNTCEMYVVLPRYQDKRTEYNALKAILGALFHEVTLRVQKNTGFRVTTWELDDNRFCKYDDAFVYDCMLITCKHRRPCGDDVSVDRLCRHIQSKYGLLAQLAVDVRSYLVDQVGWRGLFDTSRMIYSTEHGPIPRRYIVPMQPQDISGYDQALFSGPRRYIIPKEFFDDGEDAV